MRFQCRQDKVIRQLMVACLAVLLLLPLLDISSAFARGRRGGGAAGALDDFDLFLMMQTNNGLPANLVNGFEPANSIAGDGTMGVGGTIMFNPQQQTINSQSGDAVTLLPVTVNGDNGPRAGMARKLGPDGLPPMLSLKSVPVPTVPELTKFIRDPKAAILLGKALFWDAQAGSDGNACASCHFHAGADNHMKNQLSPGLKAFDNIFQATAHGAGGPNYKLKPKDFPFHRLADPLDRNSEVLFDSNDVVSSQGTFGGVFQQLGPNGKEQCGDRPTPDSFNVNGVITRRVAPRNTPSVINAVFNYRNFWDGRANNSFNGVNPFGPRDPDAKVLEQLPDGTTVWTTIALRNASLASQAVGPALSDFEMSCANRTFKDLGRKLLALRPLRLQKVDPQDSVLGAHAATDRRGIKQSYPELIRAAFDPRWWSSLDDFDGYTQMETNFSLYWGLAIMMYESTLVSDETPFDKLVGNAGHAPDYKALTTQQLRGLGLFRGKGQCLSCHKGAEFTGAATSLQPESGEGTVIESMLLKTGQLAVYDNGFYNIGVRPAAEDRGVGATDPFGNALSFSRNWFNQLLSRTVADPVWVDPCLFSIFFDASACWVAPNANDTRIVAEGAFKTPSLRNVALTQPYFHNGSRLTLEQVVEFYNRGGDRRGPDDNDTTGFVADDALNGGTTNLHPAIKPLGLTKGEISDLVAFLRHALTDTRVACEQAPFDHPSLRLHNGHAGDENAVRDRNHDGQADDLFEQLPAVGRNGRDNENCLRNDDGSRVVALADTGGQVPPPTVPPPSVPPPSVPPPNVPPPTVPTPSVPTPSVPTPSVPTPSVPTPTVPTPSVPTPSAPASTDPAVSATASSAFKPRANTSASRTATVAATASASGSPALASLSTRDFDFSASKSGFKLDDRGDESRGFSMDRSSVDSSTSDERKSSELERSREWSKSPVAESVERNQPQVPPVANINAPAEVMVRSRVTLYGSVNAGTTFNWVQTAGASVALSGEDTLAPSFTAPANLDTLVFELTATNSDGASVSVNRVIKTIPDSVTVSNVVWSKQQGKGKVSLVAASSAITANTPVPPDGMTMNATFWNKDIPAGLAGSATKPIVVPMTLVKDMPGQPPVCASKLPCFSAALVDGIIDPASLPASPQFVPPTTVIVKSSLGGYGTVQGKSIQIKQAGASKQWQDAAVVNVSVGNTRRK